MAALFGVLEKKICGGVGKGIHLMEIEV